MHEDQSNFSITNLLTQPNKQTNNEENSSSRNSSSVSPLSEDEPIVPEALAGMLNFNPLLMQQMAQNAATFALNSNPSQKPNPAIIKSDPIVSSEQQELPTTSASVPQPANPEWYNAMNYLNMASRQLQFMTAGAHPGWDPRLNWLNPYIQKSQHKRKGGQIRFTNEQTDALEHMFDNNKYLSNVQRRKLAKTLSLSERQVKTWFQNRRAKWRRVRKDGEDEEDLANSLLSTSGPSSTAPLIHNGPNLYRGLNLSSVSNKNSIELFGLLKTD